MEAQNASLLDVNAQQSQVSPNGEIASVNKIVTIITQRFINAKSITVYWIDPVQYYNGYLAEIVKIKVDENVDDKVVTHELTFADTNLQWINISRVHMPWINRQRGFKQGDTLWVSIISTTITEYKGNKYYPSKCYGYDSSKVTESQITSLLDKYGAPECDPPSESKPELEL